MLSIQVACDIGWNIALFVPIARLSSAPSTRSTVAFTHSFAAENVSAAFF